MTESTSKVEEVGPLLKTPNGTTPSAPVTTQSTPMNSVNYVEGIHFGTVQSEGYQLVPDHDFSQGTYIGQSISYWYPTSSVTPPSTLWTVGDATVFADGEHQGLMMSRIENPSVSTDLGGTVRALPHPSFESNDGGIAVSGSYGGLASPVSVVSQKGMVWATVRLTSLSGSPTVSLQIVDYNPTTKISTIVASTDLLCPNNRLVKGYVGYALGSQVSTPNEMYVQVVQYGAITSQQWLISEFGFIDESIFWEFSNDGGNTWCGAYDIRNNPYGILNFPTIGNIIEWRATGYRTNMSISALRIRPIYLGTKQAAQLGISIGPNNCIDDFSPDILSDPLFEVGVNPVLKSWNAAGSKAPLVASS